MEEVLDCIQPIVSATANEALCRPYSREEVNCAFAQMHPHKAPGPDGMNPFFYQKFWDIIGDDVSAVVLSILHGHPIPPALNRTFVALILKKQKPNLISDFHPISLCNVIYKLVTKVIANRVKPLLPGIIFDTQGAFVQGRLISDNILIAFEIMYAMQGNPSFSGFMVIKLDMSEAFDRVEWPFLANVMLDMGFYQQWLDLVMRCVKMASFSFLINGAPKGHNTPSRGIRQGDPISLYLFLFCSKGLSGFLKKAV